MTTTIKFFDFATNMTNAADAHGTAAARRSCIADGTAYRVEFTTNGVRHYWNGSRYDALSLARGYRRNPHYYQDVTLIDPCGFPVDLETARY